MDCYASETGHTFVTHHSDTWLDWNTFLNTNAGAILQSSAALSGSPVIYFAANFANNLTNQFFSPSGELDWYVAYDDAYEKTIGDIGKDWSVKAFGSTILSSVLSLF